MSSVARVLRVVIRRHGDLKMETFRVNFSVMQAETRQVREGEKMLMQGRSNEIRQDGSIKYGEWETFAVITNYGDCLDKKPTFWQRLFGV